VFARRLTQGRVTKLVVLPRNAPGFFPAAVPGLAAGNHPLVEAGGQHIHGFRRGLDYAFIRALK
jgi:hypothetical protein